MNTIQAFINQLFKHKWLGLLGYLILLTPFVLLLMGQAGLAGFLPDKISYQGNSWWELALGLLLIVVIVAFTIASIIRAATNRQYGWLIGIVFFFPIAFFYLLLGDTQRLERSV